MTEIVFQPEYTIYNQHGIRVNDQEREQALHESDEDITLVFSTVLEELGVEKPQWFIDAEDSARDFMRELGFDNLPSIFLLREDDLLDEFEMRDPPSTIAQREVNVFFVREKRIEEIRQSYSEDFATSALVHELAHGTVSEESHITLQINPEGSEYGYTAFYRTGFDCMSRKGRLGGLFEEGFAEFTAGYYRRLRIDPSAMLVDLPKHPTHQLPPHFARNVTASGIPDLVSGPDGYIMELLAWGLENQGIITAEKFITNLFATRREETQTEALRLHAWSIEQLDPGLYVYLRDLQYSQDAWYAALNKVLGNCCHEQGGMKSRLVEL